MKTRLAILCFAVLSWPASSAQATSAQPVPVPEEPSTQPQISIDGVGIGTLVLSKKPDHDKAEAGLNLSDSALVIGGAQVLYGGSGVGSFALGGTTIEESNRGFGTSLFLHQAFVDFQTETFEALVGRSANPTAHVVDFPTLRGDDLVTLTNPLNPFSIGANAEEHRYSNVAQLSFNQRLKYFEHFHVQHLINSAGIGTDEGINSFGATLEYLGMVGNEVFETIPSWSLGFEHITLNSSSPEGLHQIFAGAVINLNHSVTDHWDLRVQNIVSFGSKLATLSNATESYQADSNAVAASLRYLASPFGKPGYQLGVTAGYKTYFDVASAKSLGLALTGVKRLGQGFDLVAQYQGQWRDSALAAVQSNGLAFEQTFEVGFVMNFNATINEHISPRRTILNQQHQYLLY